LIPALNGVGWVNAQENAYFKMAVTPAQLAQRKWGVPASVTLAQGALESGWGVSALARKAYNFFGIKAGAHMGPEGYAEFPTIEFVDGRKTREMARFARYATPAESFQAHALLLAMSPRYRPAMEVAHDPALFAEQLQRCGYSTNPNYAQQLVDLINQFDLTQYDVPPGGPPAAQQEVAA
jgi:flagellum-specific peptidoglycan hydrolase FlgJ